MRPVPMFGVPLDFPEIMCYNVCEDFCTDVVRRLTITNIRRAKIMRHIETVETKNLCESAKKGGCGECQTSCQSACKTSCGIANQQCEHKEEK